MLRCTKHLVQTNSHRICTASLSSNYSLDNYELCIKVRALEQTVERLRKDIDSLKYAKDIPTYTEVEEEYLKAAG